MKSKWLTRSLSLAAVVGVLSTSLLFYSHTPVGATSGLVSVELGVNSFTPGELIEKRTRTSKTTELAPGKFALDVSIGSIHYEDNGWQEIDNEFVLAVAPWDWEMLKADYHIRVKEDFTSSQIIEFEKQGETVEFQPMALEWTNDLDQIQQVSMPQDVPPEITNPIVDLLPAVGVPSHQGTIRWPDAYGAGIDFEWKCTPSRLAKILQIDSLANLPTPEPYIIAGSNPALRLNLIFDPSTDLDILVDGVLWGKKTKIQTFDTIEFRKDSEVLWGFMPLRYWDSSNDPEVESGQSVATLEKRGNKLYISIRVPYSWLQSAIFPVFIDTDVTVQVAATNDDASEKASDGSISLTGDYHYMHSSSAAAGRWWAGLRFVSGSFPSSGTTIDVAYITVVPYSVTYDDANLNIHFEELAAPAAFTTDAYSISSRDRTEASTSWIQTGGVSQSPSIVTPLQEIFDSLSPSVIVVLTRPNEDVVKQLIFRSYDYDDNLKGGILHFEWEEGGGNPEVGVLPITYDFGVINTSSTTNSTTTYFALGNNSTMQTDMTILVTTANWSGGTEWVHSNTATPGADTAGVNSQRGGTWGSTVVIVESIITGTPNFIYENCPATTNFTYGLSLKAPTSFSDGVEKEIVVRISAAAG